MLSEVKSREQSDSGMENNLRLTINECIIYKENELYTLKYQVCKVLINMK